MVDKARVLLLQEVDGRPTAESQMAMTVRGGRKTMHMGEDASPTIRPGETGTLHLEYKCAPCNPVFFQPSVLPTIDHCIDAATGHVH